MSLPVHGCMSLLFVVPLQHFGLTRKKVQRQCSEDLQLQFMAEISMFDPAEMIIWVDETGSARRNSVRSYGYGLKGMRATSHA